MKKSLTKSCTWKRMISFDRLFCKQKEPADENKHFQSHIFTEGNGIVVFKLERLKVLFYFFNGVKLDYL